MPVEVNGFCEERFQPLQDAFIANFEEGLEAGASLAMTHHGAMVVDLWAGTRDAEGKLPWERDTIAQLFSTTKIMVILCILKLIDKGLLGALFAQDGATMGVRYLSSNIIEQATTQQAVVHDLILGPARFGLGLGLDSKGFPAPSPTAFHWGGFGGSWLVMDRASSTSFAYAMNGLHVPSLDGDDLLDRRQQRYWDVVGRIIKDLDGSSRSSQNLEK